MTKRSQEAYGRVFRTLKELCPRLSPQTLMMDFEVAAKRAFQSVFPTAKVTGCFFHLKQSFVRRMQEEHLIVRYREDGDFRRRVSMIPALAFVRPGDIARGLEELQDDAPSTDDGLNKMFDYFERTYVGSSIGRSRSRRPALFPHDFWSCYERITEGLPRTNNHVESWHNAFQKSLGLHHPDTYKLVAAFLREQSLTEQKLADVLRGEPQRSSKATYVRVAKNLSKLVEEYDQRCMLEYLRGVAQSFSL
ncbi:uncharacterized protein LOC121833694 [Ixodes scapularis]|uniref:uncharacterized protein LOC121833694 n=1 Tax=Ixodes scapularis TaxID=6945 RepID=UPI001A9E8EEA|nr:uncharacterized protein LOC121833694 [Ixodes scapularis]